MAVHVAMLTLVVDDYDRGIAFYRNALGLTVLTDTDMGGGKRWVVLAGPSGARLLLARAADERQRAAIGNQAGGRVGFFMETDDFARDHAKEGGALLAVATIAAMIGAAALESRRRGGNGGR